MPTAVLIYACNTTLSLESVSLHSSASNWSSSSWWWASCHQIDLKKRFIKIEGWCAWPTPNLSISKVVWSESLAEAIGDRPFSKPNTQKHHQNPPNISNDSHLKRNTAQYVAQLLHRLPQFKARERKRQKGGRWHAMMVSQSNLLFRNTALQKQDWHCYSCSDGQAPFKTFRIGLLFKSIDSSCLNQVTKLRKPFSMKSMRCLSGFAIHKKKNEEREGFWILTGSAWTDGRRVCRRHGKTELSWFVVLRSIGNTNTTKAKRGVSLRTNVDKEKNKQKFFKNQHQF